MNFDDTPQEAAYRARVREWIAAHAPDFGSLPPEQNRLWHPVHKDMARQWQQTKAAAGYACISWPKERGGAGGSAIEEAIFSQEELAAGVQFHYFATGLRMLLPALMEHTTDPASLAQVAPAVRGDTIWCQLFSEPSSGSDSAGIRTRAQRDPGSQSGAGGGDWIVTGQKVWNSGAQASDYGMVVTRTDPDVPKHKGLTVFWLDMKSPGVEVRPIRMMSGDYEFNEVFLTDVRIPDNQRVGEVNGGWKVIISTLMNERVAVGSVTGINWRDILKLARETPSFDGMASQDPAFREWLADYYTEVEAIRLLSFRTMTALSRGEAPSPAASAGKLLWANSTQAMTARALDLLESFGQIDDPDLAHRNGTFHHRFLWSPGLRLGGGSDEIMKNIIAERVLGLPGDPRVDKDVPFRDIPSGR
ncbi:MAG: acyl-CoA dehydrogenase family protein [Novosphingobium sp.]